MSIFGKASSFNSIIDNERRATEGSRMVELPVPPPESDCRNGRTAGSSLTRSKTLLISPQGQCTPIPDDDEPALAPQSPEAALASKSLRQNFRGSIMYFLLQALLWLKDQGKEKDVDATEDVLARYHNLYLYGAVPLTIKVRTAIRSGTFGHTLLFLEFVAAVISVVAYVNSSYAVTPAYWALTAPKVCATFFAADYILKLYSAPVRLYYLVSVTGLVDLLSTLSVLSLWSEFRSDVAIPHMFLVIRALRILPTLISAGIVAGTITQQIFLLTMYTLGGVFIAAGILQWVEYKATSAETKAKNGCGPTGCFSFYDSFYFVIVTLTTVGYGDLTPKSDWGRLVTLLIMLGAVLILPAQINKILQLAERRPYGDRFAIQKAVGSSFVVLSGNLSVRTVQRFLSGFYHPCHDKDMAAFPIRVVVMAPFKPSYEMKTLLTHYTNRVQFIEGTPLKESDLDRVGATYASAVFLLADEHAQDFDAEDAAQITRTLSVHRHCGQKVRVIVELLNPDTCNNAIWDESEEGIEIICPEAVRFQLLARSCHVKGFSTFVTNLFRSGLMLRRPTSGHWMTQYDHGLRQKIFPVILPSCFSEDSLMFEEVVEIVYTKCNAVLIGLDIKVGDDSRSVVLYPRGRTVLFSDIGLVIARDLQVTENISKYGRSGRRGCFFRTLDVKDVKPDLEMAVKKRPRRQPSVSSNIPQQEGDQDSRKPSSGGSKRFDVQGQFRDLYSSSSSNGQSNSHSEQRPPNTSFEVERLFSSLEDVIDMATSWPPLRKWDKPDPTVLERRESTILESLRQQTMNVVVLKHPHVLLCIEGRWPLNLFYFVANMRLPFMPNLPIVVLHPKEPTASQWGCVGLFEDVYFVRGSALYELDLVRAGVIQAEKVVILTQGFEDPVDESGLLLPKVNKLDVNNIVIAANVERLLNPVRGKVLVELQQEIQLQFLRPHIRIDADLFEPKMFQRDRDSQLLFVPPFIEGKGLCPASFTFLSYSTFFNRNAVSMLEQLACGRSVRSHLEEDGESSPVRRLDQILVPESYVGRTYEELFLGLLHNEKMVALGLYRPPGTGGSSVFFVYTNPSPSTELVHGDLAYVLQ